MQWGQRLADEGDVDNEDDVSDPNIADVGDSDLIVGCGESNLLRASLSSASSCPALLLGLTEIGAEAVGNANGGCFSVMTFAKGRVGDGFDLAADVGGFLTTG